MPVTLTANAAVPTVAAVGEMDVSVGIGSEEAETVKEEGAEATPKLETVIDAAPLRATSEAGMFAVSCVELTNVVARGELFQSTTEPFTKFAPFTVSVNPAELHDGVVFEEVVEADMEVIEGGTTVNWIPPVVPPPGPMVSTLT